MPAQSHCTVLCLAAFFLSIKLCGVRGSESTALGSPESASSSSSSSDDGFAVNQTEVAIMLLSVVHTSSPIPPSWNVSSGDLFRGSWIGVSVVNGSHVSTALSNTSVQVLRIDFASLFTAGNFRTGTIRLDLLDMLFPLISLNASNATGVASPNLTISLSLSNTSLPALLQSLDLRGVQNLRLASPYGPQYCALNGLPSNLSYVDLSQCQLEGVLDLTGVAFPVLLSPWLATAFPAGAVFNLSGNVFSGAVDLTLLPLQPQPKVSGSPRIPISIVDVRQNPQLPAAFITKEGQSALFASEAAALANSPYGVGILLDPSMRLEVQPTAGSFPFPTPQAIYCLVNSTSEIVHMLRIEKSPTRINSEGTTIPEPTFLRMINAETFQECNFTLAASLTFPVTGYIAQSTVFGTVMKGCVPDGVLYARQAPSISPQIDLVLGDGSMISYGQCPQPVFLDHSGEYYSFSPNPQSSTKVNLAVKYFSDFDNQGGNVSARGITSAMNETDNGGMGVASSTFMLWPIFFNPNSTENLPTAPNSQGVFRYFNQKLLINRLNETFPRVDDQLSSISGANPWSEVLFSPDANGTRPHGAVYLRNRENQTATYYQYWYGPVSSTSYYYPGDITYFTLQNLDGLVKLTLRVFGTNPIANLTPGTTRTCLYPGVLQYKTPMPTKESIESGRNLSYSRDLIHALSNCLPTIVNGVTISPQTWTSAYYKLDSLNQFRSEGSLYFENSELPGPTKSIHFDSSKQVGLWPPVTVCADVGYPYNGRMNISFEASGDFKIALYNVSKHFSELRICTGTAVLWYLIESQQVLFTNASQSIFTECFPIGTETTSLAPPFTAGIFRNGSQSESGVELWLLDRLGVRLRLTEANCQFSSSNPFPASLQTCSILEGLQTNSTWMAQSFLGAQPLRNGMWRPGIGPAVVKWNEGTAPAFFCQNWEEFMNNSTRIRQRLADLCYESIQCTIDIASCYSVALYIGSLAGCYLGKGYQLPDLILPSLPPGWEFDGQAGIRSMGSCPTSDPPYAQALLANTLTMLVGHNITLLVQCTSSDGEDAILRVCPHTVSAGVGPFFDVETFPVLVTKAAAGIHDEINLDLTCSVCTSYIGVHAYPLPLGLIGISSAMSVLFILLANALDPVVKPAIIAFRIRMSSIGLLLSSKERQFYEDRLQALVRPAVHDADYVLSHAERVCERVEQLYRERLQRVRENPRDWAINEDSSSYVFVETGKKANPNTELNQVPVGNGAPAPTALPLARGNNFHSYSTTSDVVNTSFTGRQAGAGQMGRGEETELGSLPPPPNAHTTEQVRPTKDEGEFRRNVANGLDQASPDAAPKRKSRVPKADSDETSTVRDPDRDEMAFPSEKKDGEKLFNVALRSVLHASYRLVPQQTLQTLDNGNDPVLCDLMDLREACEGAALYFKQLREAEAASRKARKAAKKAARGQGEEDPGAALLGVGPITRTSASTSYHTALTVDDRRQSHATSVAPSVKSSSNGLTQSLPRSNSIYTVTSSERSRKSSRSRASTNRGGFLQAVEDANYAANQQIDGFSIRTLKSSLVKAPIAQLMDSLQATHESFILIEDYVAWKYLVPKLWYINVQLLLVWIYFFFCLSNALDKSSGVDSTSSRYALVYFLFLNSSIPGSLLVNLLYRRLALYQENEQLLQDIFDMVRSMLTNRYFLCAIAVVLPPLFSHIIVGLIIFCPITFGVVAVLGILRKIVSRLPVPEPKEDKTGVHFCHRFNWLIILAHLIYRAFVTLCTVFLLQVGFNYALLKIYRGASADWPSVIEFDWTSRSLYCSALQYEKSGITFYQHILNTFLP